MTTEFAEKRRFVRVPLSPFRIWSNCRRLCSGCPRRVFTKGRTRAPYPPKFRQQIIKLVRAGRHDAGRGHEGNRCRYLAHAHGGPLWPPPKNWNSEPMEARTPPQPAPPPTQELSLRVLLQEMIQKGASDLHITVGERPKVRVDGDLASSQINHVLTPKDTLQLAYSILTENQKKRFETEDELDFSFITMNFHATSKNACCADVAAAPIPVYSITVRELRANGQTDLIRADLNRDGVLDQADIQAFMNGERPTPTKTRRGAGLRR